MVSYSLDFWLYAYSAIQQVAGTSVFPQIDSWTAGLIRLRIDPFDGVGEGFSLKEDCVW